LNRSIEHEAIWLWFECREGQASHAISTALGKSEPGEFAVQSEPFSYLESWQRTAVGGAFRPFLDKAPCGFGSHCRLDR
jgi:hypothetical protein